jgi:histidine triad (HIT) family protein
MNRTIFERIAAKEIPADIVYEDEQIIAFRDIDPKAPVHVLLVPKKVVPRLAVAEPLDQALLGHLLLKAPQIAALCGIAGSGFRVVINNGRDAGECVPHLHCHLLGGRVLGWPPG